jgi:hypothetical protein
LNPKPELLDQIERVLGFKVFIGLGGNFVAAVPDKSIAEAAMRRLRQTVAISTKLNRGHLVHGELALELICTISRYIELDRGELS